ncbi:hypothetical protein BSLG_005419 [Batrachochytrium salamandrivorans]|nr:hypothetical protein BSLG_005419 [Batrachochytrium salamandrivorans]
MLPSVKRSQSLTALTVNVVDDDEAEDGETELDPGYYGGQNPINTTATSRLIPLRTPSIPADDSNSTQASPRVSLLGPVRRLSSLWKGVLRYVWPRRTSPTRSREMHQQQRRDHRFLYRRIVTDPGESLSDGDCPDTDPSLDAIHSFFGESVIVSLLSCCCIVGGFSYPSRKDRVGNSLCTYSTDPTVDGCRHHDNDVYPSIYCDSAVAAATMKKLWMGRANLCFIIIMIKRTTASVAGIHDLYAAVGDEERRSM